MDYLDIIHRLEEITTTESAKQDLRLAYRGIRDEKVNQMPEEQAKERFVYYMRPYFIFQLYPRLYREKRWLGLTFDEYIKGINKALVKNGKNPIKSIKGAAA
ncbi:hypothetical protein CUM68_10025 [Enterococcus faecium]|uniref:hypothetical protein n=1 Tax=Enterococcus faecium TaxID=1352 RepID=UPI000CF133F9|nr:hypothetical protein [Enterococcus faecium]EGP5273319.1 hypothetical protein [Enterococcus faecium]PQB46465.1 hypothetical protein CUN27_09640 [Enterococcus faecium]PQD90880.1 hypothetical protein CUM68_10025 [Enterococcus faecium]RBT11208.1 hypothetical protein EA93_02511 [Enterococcus faecium]